jgi:hypothetical protein
VYWNTLETPDLIKCSISFDKTEPKIKTDHPCIISEATETVNQSHNFNYEHGYKHLNFKEFCLLGYNALLPVGNQLAFWRTMLPQSSQLNYKPSKKPR